MIAFLTRIGSLVGLSGTFAAIAGGAFSILTIGLLLWGLKSCYDSSVIEDARRADNAKAVELKAEADQNAAEARGSDRARATVEAEQLKETIDEAIEQGTDPRAAYYQCIRLQQQARTAHRPAPAC